MANDLWPSQLEEATTGGNGVQLWPDELERSGDIAPTRWRSWLKTMFPRYVKAGFGRRHKKFWRHVQSVTRKNKPRPFVGIWPRGGAKTSSAELAAVFLGLTGRRGYGLYIRSTQDRADDSVSNIGALLEEPTVDRFYPKHAQRKVNKYGSPQGWRRNRLRTAGGLTIDALGFDTAARGIKIEDMRPDFIILDDVDERHDTEDLTQKKLQTLKESILPAGASNVFVIAIQNLIIPHGIFARLADGRADFLALRVLSGPEPALVDMVTTQVTTEDGTVRTVIIDGKPTWEGQGIEECQHLMDLMGPVSFDRECQHDVHRVEGALWTKEMIDKTRVTKRPAAFKRIVVAVDPSGGGDAIGILIGGIGFDDHIYVLEDVSVPGKHGPRYWGRKSVASYHKWLADKIVAERNFGGDMVRSNIKTVDETVPVTMVAASRGKEVRAEPVASLYGSDINEGHVEGEERMHHVGYFPALEREMTGWVPGTKPSPNRMDALVWLAFELWLKNRKLIGKSSFVRGSRRVHSTS